MTTKRVCELEVDDTFLYYGIEHRVIRIEKLRLFYRPVQFSQSSSRDSFGYKSQMKVEITGKWIRKINPPKTLHLAVSN